MYLCNDNHEEICYAGRNCPVCEKIKEISDLEDKINELKERIEELTP
jgi:transcription initiation factor IIE alpha subunit